MVDGMGGLQVATALTALVGNLSLVAAAAYIRWRRPGMLGSMAVFAAVCGILVGLFQLVLPVAVYQLGLTVENVQGAAWVLGTLGAVCDIVYALAIVSLIGGAVTPVPTTPAAPVSGGPL